MVRPASSSELEAAVRHIVTPLSGRVEETQFQDYLRLATTHRRDLGGPWVAVQDGLLAGAVIPVVSPGKTILLFMPLAIRDHPHADATARIVDALCARAARDGLALAQVLLDAHDHSVYALLTQRGFARLAELLYLQVNPAKPIRAPEPGAGYRWLHYAPDTHALFARTVLASYERSLDCPALNGLRHIDDILAGHKGLTSFDPDLWFLLLDHDDPVAVLLLNRVGNNELMELVYLGLVPSRRGRGIGDLMLRKALHTATSVGCARLSLAVDADNLPALKLYWRHGLQAVGRKLAMLRTLQPRSA